ncbi:MAG: aldehyde dehydrogenase family protein [Deltaproteobacteria bacterium]|nr:aldehyde dehydrogenase family protein [Deltaproteobacteria bacterium]
MSEQAMIAGMVEKARKAQKTIENATQEQVRELAAAIGWYAIQNAVRWAEVNFEETKMGNIPSKIARTQARARGLMRDLNRTKTVGVIEVDEEKQLMKIAKPVGVIGGLVPTTVPAGVVFIKSMNALMGRNAIIFAPHPRAKKTTNMVANDLRELLGRLGYDKDLIQCIETPSMNLTRELMAQVDLVIATGGAGMVKAAYSSGTPAYGVGAGNVVAVIDETADLADAAKKIVISQQNDLAIGCSTENAIAVQKDVYDACLDAFKAEGAYVCNAEEKKKLQNTLWVDGHLNPEVICTPAKNIAEKSGFTVPDDCTCIIVEETGYGPEYPFSGEKLSVVVTAYKWDTFEDAINLVNGIQAYSGAGHSCGIHSFNEERIMEYAMRTKTARVGVRFAQNMANAGNWNNGMPFTITLGCGTWGGNITCENITAKHYINTTWVAREIPNFTVPTDEELFGKAMTDKRI